MDSKRLALKDYLSAHQPNYGHENIHSMLEMLWDSYTMYNPIDNEKIRGQIEALRPIMDILSWEQENDLFDVVSDLCGEYERTAFLEGLRAGVRLAVELMERWGIYVYSFSGRPIAPVTRIPRLSR